MAKRIIRLSENDLERLIKMVIQEQDMVTPSGNTDSTPACMKGPTTRRSEPNMNVGFYYYTSGNMGFYYYDEPKYNYNGKTYNHVRGTLREQRYSKYPTLQPNSLYLGNWSCDGDQIRLVDKIKLPSDVNISDIRIK